MIRIALVEDEAEVRAQLQGYVQRHTRQYGTEFAVTEFADGMELLDDYRPVYDVLFLDVEMKHLDGMETARRVRELDKDVIIVFITNMAQYAIGGYAVGALDYVLKPVNYYQFCTKLSRAVQRVERRRGGQVVLQLAGGGMQVLSTNDIYYLETRDRLLWYHTAKGEFSVRASLASAEKQLAQYHFSRCNQCYLVNLQYVKAVENDFVHVNTDRLEISRRQRAAFLTAVASYIGGVL